MTWTNDDGVLVRFGVEKAKMRNAGHYAGNSPVQWVELLFRPTDDDFPLIADAAVTINPYLAIPEGALIEAVEIQGSVTVVGATAVLSVGTTPQDGAGTSTKAAFVDAATATEINTGGENIAGWVGSLVGTILTEAMLVTWEVDTDEFDSGEAVIRIKYSMPPKNTDTLAWVKP